MKPSLPKKIGDDTFVKYLTELIRRPQNRTDFFNTKCFCFVTIKLKVRLEKKRWWQETYLTQSSWPPHGHSQRNLCPPSAAKPPAPAKQGTDYHYYYYIISGFNRCPFQLLRSYKRHEENKRKIGQERCSMQQANVIGPLHECKKVCP